MAQLCPKDLLKSVMRIGMASVPACFAPQTKNASDFCFIHATRHRSKMSLCFIYEVFWALCLPDANPAFHAQMRIRLVLSALTVSVFNMRNPGGYIRF